MPYYYSRRDIICAPERCPMNQIVPRDYFRSYMQPFEQVFRHLRSVANMDNRALRQPNVTPATENFEINLDVHHFGPEEIEVKVVDRYITIMAKHEEKMDEHGFISRQFLRRYTLPQGFLPDTVQSNLSSDGILTITAPKVLPMPSTGERIVPIIKTGPVKRQTGSHN